MKLDWDRPGVVRATLKVQELATLVAGTRVAAAALARQSAAQAEELERVLAGFDRAMSRLRPVPGRPSGGGHATGAEVAKAQVRSQFR